MDLPAEGAGTDLAEGAGADPDTLNSGSNLAVELGELGRHAEAARLHKRILGERQRTLGWDHADTLASEIHLTHEMGQLVLQNDKRKVASTCWCWGGTMA